MFYPDLKSCSLRIRQSCSSIRDYQAQAEGGCIQTIGKIAKLDADADVTLVDVDTTVEMDVDIQGRMEEDVTAVKEINAAESKPTVFDDDKMQEKHLDNIKKYQCLKRKPISIAEGRKNIIVYLKNMAVYKMKHFKGMTYDQESKLRAEVEVSGSRTYQKIIKVGGITQAYQSFKDMLKDFDRKDLDALWRLVKERFSIAMPTVDKEKALWVELKRLFEPDADDVIFSLTIRRHDMYMLAEKDYPLTNGIMTLMLSTRLQVEEDSEMARDFVMKIFVKANQPRSTSLDTYSN
nr:hypothetical protein [Tanacetum cinerariifolium]